MIEKKKVKASFYFSVIFELNNKHNTHTVSYTFRNLIIETWAGIINIDIFSLTVYVEIIVRNKNSDIQFPDML